MSYRSGRLKAMGLSILATLGMMTFATAGAQAGEGEWLISSGGEVVTVEELSPQLTEISLTNEGATSLFILNKLIFQKCGTMSSSNAHLVPTGHGKVDLTFKECYYTDSELNKLEACGIEDFTIKLFMLLIKHNGEGFILFSPQDGLTFGTLFNTGEECPLPESWSLKGSFVAKFVGESFVTRLITTKSTSGLFGDAVKYGGNVTHLEWDLLMSLAGVHKGLPWTYHLL